MARLFGFCLLLALFVAAATAAPTEKDDDDHEVKENKKIMKVVTFLLEVWMQVEQFRQSCLLDSMEYCGVNIMKMEKLKTCYINFFRENSDTCGKKSNKSQ